MDTHCVNGHLWADNFRTHTNSKSGNPVRYCKTCRSAMSKAYRAKQDPIKMKAYYKRVNAERYARLRGEAITAYGGACQYCGTTVPAWLAFDHVNDDGHSHRKVVSPGSQMVTWLRDNDYPDMIQLLCHNCNTAKKTKGESVARQLGVDNPGK